MIIAVIGKNFGDEGKGLAVDYFCGRVPHCLTVKHNGGAQAGHTVSYEDKRFVFHQLSSGSFRGADTFYVSTYSPDLFKLGEEYRDFRACAGFVPKLYCSVDAPLITIDDVLHNMLLESLRGENRHGSCGMGINEGHLRCQAGFGITFGEITGGTAEGLSARMLEIRENYGMKRCEEILSGTGNTDGKAYGGKEAGFTEYREMLNSKDVIRNAAEEMMRNAEFVLPVEEEEAFLCSAENIVFETGQGLLLDSDNTRFAPHVTASKTGLCNIVNILSKAGLTLSEVCYVSRTYVTRHGAGELPYETKRSAIGEIAEDQTNLPNPWQGAIRYATHGKVEEFTNPVKEDITRYIRQNNYEAYHKEDEPVVSLFLTHLNETGGRIVFADNEAKTEEFINMPEIRSIFDRIYLSGSVFGDECRVLSARF